MVIGRDGKLCARVGLAASRNAAIPDNRRFRRARIDKFQDVASRPVDKVSRATPSRQSRDRATAALDLAARHGTSSGNRSGGNPMSAVEMLATAPPEKPVPSREELVARARALAPRLLERAVRAERERNIPLESVQEYIDAGLIRT